MSESLLKKGLAIIYQEESCDRPNQKKKKEKQLDLISTNRVGVKKARRKLEKTQLKRTQLRKPNFTDKSKQKVEETLMEVNLELFQRLSGTTTPPSAQKIIEHHKGKLAKDNCMATTKTAEVRSVLFHNTDFDCERTNSDTDGDDV